MGVMRSLLLAASESRWLRQKAPRLGFVKAAVRRFMPGERVEDAMAAAADLARQNTTAVLTRLGENVADRREADAVTEHYLDVLQRIASSGLDVEISVKLTQLGLDIDVERCYANLRRLLERAQGSGGFVWIDMEQFAYVDRTLAIYRRALAEFPCTGVCLQAYLYRTPDDLTALMPLGGAVRLVKGAYLEPATVAHPRKGDVDAAYRELAHAHAHRAGAARGLPGRVRHARHRAHSRPRGARGGGGGIEEALRVRAPLRHPARRAAATGARGRPRSRARCLW